MRVEESDGFGAISSVFYGVTLSRQVRGQEIDDARDLWLRRDPLLVQAFGAGSLRRNDLNTGAAVGWKRR